MAKTRKKEDIAPPPSLLPPPPRGGRVCPSCNEVRDLSFFRVGLRGRRLLVCTVCESAAQQTRVKGGRPRQLRQPRDPLGNPVERALRRKVSLARRADAMRRECILYLEACEGILDKAFKLAEEANRPCNQDPEPWHKREGSPPSVAAIIALFADRDHRRILAFAVSLIQVYAELDDPDELLEPGTSAVLRRRCPLGVRKACVDLCALLKPFAKEVYSGKGGYSPGVSFQLLAAARPLAQNFLRGLGEAQELDRASALFAEAIASPHDRYYRLSYINDPAREIALGLRGSKDAPAGMVLDIFIDGRKRPEPPARPPVTKPFLHPGIS